MLSSMYQPAMSPIQPWRPCSKPPLLSKFGRLAILACSVVMALALALSPATRAAVSVATSAVLAPGAGRPMATQSISK